MKRRERAALPEERRRKEQRALCISLAVGGGYAAVNLVGGIAGRSLWLGTLAFYYLLLTGLRVLLLRGGRAESARARWKTYRRCAALMLALTLALFGIFCLTVYSGHVIAYPQYIIYAVALYTFYAVIRSIRDLAAARRYDEPILAAHKALNLAAAVISVYSLQSAMISEFGDGGPFRETMGKCVGGAAFLILLSLSAAMLVKGTKRLRQK